jgi:hypothetical protein
VSARRWWLLTISLSLWLVFFLSLSLSDWRLVLISADGDPCLHRRIGDWMIEHCAVVHRDQFSHTRFDAPLISKEWLSEVVFAAAGRAAGWNGIVLLSAAFIATILWLLHRQLLAEGNEILLSTGLVLVTALASSTHWIARPHLATHLLTVVFAGQLRQFDRGAISSKRLLFTLAPLMLLWANLHGAFLTGMVLIGCYVVATALDRAQRARLQPLVLVLAACLVASLVNPNGWKLHAQVLEFLQTPELAGLTNEFRSPNFHTGGARGFVVELLVVAGMLLVARPRLSSAELLLLGVWGYFALHSVRNVPIFAIVVTPIVAGHWNKFLRSAGELRRLELYRRVSARITQLHQSADGRVFVAIALIALVSMAMKPRLVGGEQVLATEILASRFPVAAVTWLRTNDPAVTGEMFNDYGWGGYLMLELPDHRVFTDGRNDFYGKKLIEEFNTVDDVKPGWEPVLERYRVGWTILPPKHGLNALLAMRVDWKRVYSDDVAVIYTRR